MHEFSLATEVIRLAGYEARKANALSVSEITVEIGNMSGVEADTFESALALLAEGSILANAAVKILKTKGNGFCAVCNKEYEMDRRIDTCPECHSFPSEIRGGKAFRVVSLVIENE